MRDVWPFPVQQPIAEVLEWRTDVLVSREAEQRIALRPFPREIVTYRHLLDAAGTARALELARAGVTAEWLVPVWSMAARPGITVAATDLAIPIDTTGADYRAPGHAVVAADGGEAHLVEVAAVFPDRLELAAPVGVDIADPIVAPARRGILTAPLETERSRRPHRTGTATFTLADGAALGASPYPTHLGLDVMTDPAVLRQPLRATLGVTLEQVDNGFGPIVLEPVRSYLQGRATITTVDYGAAARWARRRWLLSLQGRQRAFWLPGWGRELVLQAPIGAADTSMVVAPIASLEAYVGRHVMIEMPGGALFREVTGAGFDALGHRLAIAAPAVAVPMGTPIHWMTKARLDTDRVELVHLATRTEMSASTIEVPA
jgi:hypothetical protein